MFQQRDYWIYKNCFCEILSLNTSRKMKNVFSVIKYYQVDMRNIKIIGNWLVNVSMLILERMALGNLIYSCHCLIWPVECRKEVIPRKEVTRARMLVIFSLHLAHLGCGRFSASSTLTTLAIFPVSLMLDNMASSIVLILYGGQVFCHSSHCISMVKAPYTFALNAIFCVDCFWITFLAC